MNTLRSTLAACLALVSVAVACGTSSDGGSSGSGTNNGTLGGGDGGVGASSSAGGIGASGSTSSSGGDPQPLEDGGACAAQNADTQRKPAYLFFILDQSGSMSFPSCKYSNNDCDLQDPSKGPACCREPETPKRWTPITSALKAFVQDPLSKGITAGLELFPSVSGGFSAPVESCNVSTYATDVSKMDVTMRPLPDPGGTSFSSKWPAETTIFGTPTRAVFKAMGPIAKKWADEHTDGKTAIVLMTDGYPELCSADDNKIENVAAEISAIKAKVPTYVIGVSEKKENLDDLAALAAAGGTMLTRIDTSDPVKTQKEFLDRINEIRKSTFSCDVAIPAAPAGQTLDLAKVNVHITNGNGVKEPLGYDAICKGTKGWRFDSATDPKKIELCTATCDTFENDPDGKLGVEFGCARRDSDDVR